MCTSRIALSLDQSLALSDTVVYDLPSTCAACTRGDKRTIYVTFQCNRECWYCSNPISLLGQRILYLGQQPIDDINDIISLLRQDKVQYCCISGGEPTLEYDLLNKLIPRLSSEDIVTCLYTNADYLTLPLLRQFFEFGLQEVKISLHDRILSPTIKQLYKNFPLKIYFELVFLPNELESMVDCIQELHSQGCNSVILDEVEIREERKAVFKEHGYIGHTIAIEKTAFSKLKTMIEARGIYDFRIYLCPRKKEKHTYAID